METETLKKLTELVLKLAEAVMRMSGGDSLPYEWYSDIQRRCEELKPAHNAATGPRPDTLDKNVIYPVPGHEQPHAGASEGEPMYSIGPDFGPNPVLGEPQPHAGE